ncbi:MAG: 3'-5' exonuclease [Nitrospinae bacterium]|nr:3'-5' exonuclease [Nitrospinota bacterium]
MTQKLEEHMNSYFLNIITTGRNPHLDRIIELTILDADGHVILDTLVNPLASISGVVVARHGITNGMVALSPTLDDLWPEIHGFLKGSRVIVPDADATRHFFPDGLNGAGELICIRKRFIERMQAGCGFFQVSGQRWLEQALAHAGHTHDSDSYRTLTTAEAMRLVWNWLESNNRLHTAA